MLLQGFRQLIDTTRGLADDMLTTGVTPEDLQRMHLYKVIATVASNILAAMLDGESSIFVCKADDSAFEPLRQAFADEKFDTAITGGGLYLIFPETTNACDPMAE